MAPEDDEPSAPHRPLDAAAEALRKAAEARGVPYEAPAPRPAPEPADGDPFAAVDRALEAAAEARAHATRNPREDRAREELERLKGGGLPPSPAEDEDSEDAETEMDPEGPRIRRL